MFSVHVEPITSKEASSHQKGSVWKFYKDMWDHADVSLIPEIFHQDFTFRGSLGPVLVGHHQFAEYVNWVTTSFENYTSDILVLVENGNQVAGRTRFHGIHRKPLFGRPATNRQVWWDGAAFFTFDEGKVCDLWVLGDVHGLIGRIENDVVESPGFNLQSATNEISK